MTAAEWLNQPMDLITPAEMVWSFLVDVFFAVWAFVWRLMASGAIMYSLLMGSQALVLLLRVAPSKERDLEVRWMISCAAFFLTVAWLFIDG